MSSSQATQLHLVPPLVESGKSDQLLEFGQALSATFSPSGASLSVFITKPEGTATDEASHSGHDQPVYFSGLHSPPSAERRLFISDTLLIFTALQNLTKNLAQDQGSDGPPQDIMRKLAIDYVNFVRECWIHASQPIPRPEPLQYSGEHYRVLYAAFSLFVVVYLPEVAFKDGPVGDELMEWLNIHFIEPSTEEGDELSTLDRPWEDPNFWPYVTHATLRGLTKASSFFLKTLQEHPSEELHNLVDILVPLIADQPRLQNFSSEREFALSSRRWGDKVRALRVTMDSVPDDDRTDDYHNWWDQLSDIVGVLEGRGEVLIRVCVDLGADWKDVCAAWGIFIDTRLRRRDIADVAAQILIDMPPDPTSPEDMLYAALFTLELDDALDRAGQIDPWLAAHLADLAHALSLLGAQPPVTQREQLVLSYTDQLRSDPNLWRIAASYMYSCGDIGGEQADELILRVPLRLHEQKGRTSVARPSADEAVVGTLKQINEVCFEYQREHVRRNVCRIAAQQFAREKDYGMAVSYCTSAEDWLGMGRVVDQILAEYIDNGVEAFTTCASHVAPFLEDLQARHPNSHSVFIHRLMFALRYAQFHRFLAEDEYGEAAADLISMLEDDVAPKAWWAVLLCDSVELLRNDSLLFTEQGTFLLLRKIEEIFAGSGHGSGKDYLLVLKAVSAVGSEKEALERLKIVRLALAMYIARCTVSGVSGVVASGI